MADPELIGLVAATVTAAATEFGTEAGRRVWESLGRLVRRHPVGADDVDWESAPDSREVDELISRLTEASAKDPKLAAELAEWARAAQAEPGAEPATTVTVNISGHSKVENAIVAGTVNGGIKLR